MFLEATAVVAGYGRMPVLHGLDFHVDQGELVAVVGPNGAGKSTLMRTLARVLPLMSGTIRLRGESADRWRAPQAVRHGIAFVPQEENVFPTLSVIDNLRVADVSSRGRGPGINAILERLPVLADRRAQRAATLSGGERQMLAIASALLMGGELLLLDEPTTGLAPIIVQQLTDWIREISAEGKTVVWVVEQDPEIVLRMANRAYVMEGGQVTSEGPATKVAGSYLSGVLAED